VLWGGCRQRAIWKLARRASYCVAKCATHRAARSGPSATIELSLQDDNVVNERDASRGSLRSFSDDRTVASG
jgi:hypothetical protein